VLAITMVCREMGIYEKRYLEAYVSKCEERRAKNRKKRQRRKERKRCRAPASSTTTPPL
jgi:hypothetical protein